MVIFTFSSPQATGSAQHHDNSANSARAEGLQQPVPPGGLNDATYDYRWLAAAVTVGACTGTDTTAAAPATDAIRDPSAGPAGKAGKTEPVKPAMSEITIPAGTRLAIALDTSIGSATSRVEEPVRAHLTQAIVVEGQTALAEGTAVSGVVTDATRAAKVKGRAHVAVRFDTLSPRGQDDRYSIETTPVARTAQATKKKDALTIGGPAAGGALIGGLIGGKKGAAIGTAAGGGAGTAVVLSTRGKEVQLPKGSALTLQLSQPLTVRVVAAVEPLA